MVTKSRSKKSKKVTRASEKGPRSSKGAGGGQTRAIARAGIGNSQNVKHLMSALIPDILEGIVDIASANAVCNATGKLLRMLELELKYGGSGKSVAPKALLLT